MPKLRAARRCGKAVAWQPHAVVDGLVITDRNLVGSGPAAQALLGAVC